jgi:AcrR family transcriptional regulator
MAEAVKTKRRYDATRRRAAARATRQALLVAAGRRFLAEGYAATTLPALAAEVGVSVETIYRQFGSKAGLLRAVHDHALLGDAPVPPYRRADAAGATEQDPHRLVARWAALAAEVAPRVAPVLLLVRAAAATDLQLRSLWDELEDRRLRRMAENAQHLVDRGQLRPGRTPDEARDVLWAYTSPDLYERLVVRQGWPIDAFERFLCDGMTGALLDPAR